MVGRHQTAQEVNFLKEVFHKNWKQLKGGNTVDMMAANKASSALSPDEFKKYYSTELASLNKQLDQQKQILNSVFLDAERIKLKHRRGIVADTDQADSCAQGSGENDSRIRRRQGRAMRAERARGFATAQARAKQLHKEEQKLVEQLKEIESRRKGLTHSSGSAWTAVAEAALSLDDNQVVTGFGRRQGQPQRAQTSYGTRASMKNLNSRHLISTREGGDVTQMRSGRSSGRRSGSGNQMRGSGNNKGELGNARGSGKGNAAILRSQQREMENHSGTVLAREFRIKSNRPRDRDLSAPKRSNSSTGRSSSRSGHTNREQRPSTAGSCCTQCCGEEGHRRTRLETRFHHFLEQQFITMNKLMLASDKTPELVEKVNPGLKEFNRKVGLKPLVLDGPHPCRDQYGLSSPS
jgi:hypothetical protein